MPKAREYYIDIMLDYFTIKEAVNNRLLIGNMKNITYYKHSTFDMQKFSNSEDTSINNNI